MKNSTDTYKEVRTFTDSNAIVRVHIPDLTEQERKRRMDIVKAAAAGLLKSVAMNKKRIKTNEPRKLS